LLSSENNAVSQLSDVEAAPKAAGKIRFQNPDKTFILMQTNVN
jgi:hypothetical protein